MNGLAILTRLRADVALKEASVAFGQACDFAVLKEVARTALASAEKLEHIGHAK